MTTGVRERAPTKQELAAALKRARELTLRLVEPVADEDLVAQFSPIMSPLVWDVAHIGWFEELWLIRRIAGSEPSLERFDVKGVKTPTRRSPVDLAVCLAAFLRAHGGFGTMWFCKFGRGLGSVFRSFCVSRARASTRNR